MGWSCRCPTVSSSWDFGRKIAEESPAEIQRHPEVIRAYLGDDAGATIR